MSPRPGESSRRLNLVDAMVLIGGLAGGFGLMRAVVSPIFGGFRLHSLNAERVMIAAPCVLLGLTAALSIVTLRPPRPSSRQLATRPGWLSLSATLLAFGVVLIVSSIETGCYMLRTPGSRQRPLGYFAYNVLTYLPVIVVPAILGAWLALVVRGRLRLDRDVPGRIALVLALFWIALFLAHTAIKSTMF